jgi:hypothetical protein
VGSKDDASDTILSGNARLNRLEGKEEQQNPKTNTPKPPKACNDEVETPSKFGST